MKKQNATKRQSEPEPPQTETTEQQTKAEPFQSLEKLHIRDVPKEVIDRLKNQDLYNRISWARGHGISIKDVPGPSQSVLDKYKVITQNGYDTKNLPGHLVRLQTLLCAWAELSQAGLDLYEADRAIECEWRVIHKACPQHFPAASLGELPPKSMEDCKQYYETISGIRNQHNTTGRAGSGGGCFPAEAIELLKASQAETERAAEPAGNAMLKQGDYWQITYNGKTRPSIKDTLGMRYIAELLQNPNRGILCTELEKLKPNPGRKTITDAPSEGLSECGRERDSGPVSDATAIKQYQARKQYLEREIETTSDPVEKVEHEEELDRINGQLKKSKNIHGKQRKISDPSDKIRKSVCKAINVALNNIKGADKELWQHIKNAYRPGNQCSYRPGEIIEWEIS